MILTPPPSLPDSLVTIFTIPQQNVPQTNKIRPKQSLFLLAAQPNLPSDVPTNCRKRGRRCPTKPGETHEIVDHARIVNPFHRHARSLKFLTVGFPSSWRGSHSAVNTNAGGNCCRILAQQRREIGIEGIRRFARVAIEKEANGSRAQEGCVRQTSMGIATQRPI